MKVNRYELAGQKFGRLLAVEKEKGFWRCQCDCGKSIRVASYDLVSGRYKSCGCKHAEDTKAGMRYRHGMSHTKEHRAWAKIRERCHNPKDKNFNKYGAKGISVCQTWRESFEAFFEDMGPCPSPQHSIDRIENSGNYDLGNCRWATKKEQAINRYRTIWFEYQGTRLCQKDWARRFGVASDAITYWIKKGKSFDFIVEHFENRKQKD